MPRHEVLENHPLQLLAFEDLQAILEEMVGSFPQEWKTKAAQQEWRKLAGLVQEALLDAYLVGPAAENEWQARVAQEWQRIEEKCSAPVVREVRIGYLRLLDRTYGAIYRQVLRRVPTAVYSATGVFHLSRLLYYRYARVRAADKPPLQQLMELLYEGTELHMELEFTWKPLGDSLGVETPWRRRMNQ